MDLVERVTAEKGAPLTEREQAILDERIGAARAWLEGYAPDRARVAMTAAVPHRVRLSALVL